MKKKIVFFHLLNNFTGSPQILRNVIETAIKEGYPVELYTSSTQGFLSGIPGVNYRPNLYRRYPNRWITLFTFFTSQLILAIVLLRHLGEKSIFYTNTILPFSAIFAGIMMGKKVITHVHENEVSPRILDRFLFWWVRNLSTTKIVVSEFLRSNPKLGQKDIILLPNAVNSRITKHAVPVTWSSASFTVLMLASLRPYKGIDDFVQLSHRLPGIRFILVLSDTDTEVGKWKKNLVLGSNIEIFPVQEEVIPFFKKSHLLLNLAHPDLWLETFGMTVLEGFCFGLPAIVPTLGGVAELVDDEVNGYKIDYTQADLIESKIQDLAKNPDLWERLSKGALLTSQNYTLQEFERKVSGILNS
ncbi:glycosyltransferase family 4 protein [Algoriphagus confluentis]|uniref:Glycosyl transferase family 1 domain-containing protein n=1 Tax=Algoriphagus confluentis TaxID=1697556 RepID=A0ABQ6PNI2_9BACT|nr:hypothetical protein Aconfl_21670 [Algoriphagus confluentis]